MVSQPGEPGKPGQPASGSQGGAGGQGGEGGAGQTTGGPGGAGGTGGDSMRGPQGPQGKSAPRRALVGYVILAVTVAVSLYFSWRNTQQITNERAARSIAVNGYLVRGCARDTRKDAIFIGILSDTIRSVRNRTDIDPAIRRAYILKQTKNIVAIQAVDRQCVADIPPPIPSH